MVDTLDFRRVRTENNTFVLQRAFLCAFLEFGAHFRHQLYQIDNNHSTHTPLKTTSNYQKMCTNPDSDDGLIANHICFKQ